MLFSLRGLHHVKTSETKRGENIEMAKQHCKGVQIEVICTKRETQKKECYICVMTLGKPSGDYLKAETSEGLYFIGIPKTVKHVYRAVNVPAEVESLHLFFEGVERNLPILFK